MLRTAAHPVASSDERVLAPLRKARVLLADDHVLLAEACRRVLEPEFEVVGIVENGKQLVDTACELQPDVVVLDVAMPQLSGLDAAERLHALLPSTKLVFLTVNTEPEIAAEAFRRGAVGYVLKSSSVEELQEAVRAALRSELYLSPAIAKETIEALL